MYYVDPPGVLHPLVSKVSSCHGLTDRLNNQLLRFRLSWWMPPLTSGPSWWTPPPPTSGPSWWTPPPPSWRPALTMSSFRRNSATNDKQTHARAFLMEVRDCARARISKTKTQAHDIKAFGLWEGRFVHITILKLKKEYLWNF